MEAIDGRALPARHSVSVAGVIVDGCGRALLSRRRDNQRWEAPGGVRLVRGKVATMALVPAVVDAVGGDVPVLAAGGIADGRGVAAALALGAGGAMLGTRFLLTHESDTHDAYRAALSQATITDTVYSTVFDGGWPARGGRHDGGGPRFGRRGLGRRLISHLLDQAGPAVVYLAANSRSYGRALFQSVGFHSIDTVTRHAGRFTPQLRTALSGPLRSASMSDREPMAALDRKVFGADRRRVLTELFGFVERVLVAEDGRGALAGFAAAWRNEDDLVIGPLVAADLAVARTLITAVAAEDNGSVRVDIFGCHRELADWAAARGLLPCGSATLMVHGGDLPGERDKLFAPASGPTG